MIRRLWRTQRATLVYVLAAGISRAGSILLVPMYTRVLTEEEYGRLSLFQSLLSLLPLWFSLGLSAGLAKVYFDSPKEFAEGMLGHVARRMALVVLASAALHALVLVGIRALWPSTLYAELVVLATGAVLAVGSIGDMYLRASRRAGFAATVSVASLAVSLASAIFFVVVLQRGLIGVLEAQLLAAVVPAAVSLWLVLSWRKVSPPTPPSFRASVRFSLPFIPHFLAGWVFSLADRWTMKFAGLDKELGHYALAVQLASPVPIVSGAVNDAQSAEMGRLMQEKGGLAVQQASRQFARNYLIPTAAIAALILLSLPFLKFIIGPRFENALWLVPVVLVMSLIDVLYAPASNVLYFTNRPLQIPAVTVWSAIGTLAFLAALVPLFGLPGLLVARVLGAALRSGLCWNFALKPLPLTTPST